MMVKIVRICPLEKEIEHRFIEPEVLDTMRKDNREVLLREHRILFGNALEDPIMDFALVFKLDSNGKYADVNIDPDTLVSQTW